MNPNIDCPRSHVLALVTEVGWWLGIEEIRAQMEWGPDNGHRGRRSLYGLVRGLITSGELESRGGVGTTERFEVRRKRP